MADHKFTLEEILNEYSADGKRSGIRHTSEQPLSRGTLETEKLVNAATSERPLSRERAGYDTVAPPPENAEELVDIKSTISHIKASKAAQAAQEADAAPCCGNAFPPSTSGGKTCPLSTPPVPDGIRPLHRNRRQRHDGAVKLMEEDTAAPQRHRPNVRQMEDSTVHGKRKETPPNAPDSAYLGICHRRIPAGRAGGTDEEPPVSRRHWEEEQDYYYQGSQQTSRFRPVRQRVRSHTFGADAEKRQPDNLELVKKTLENLRNVVFFRFIAVLVLTVAGAVLACTEVLGNGAFTALVTPRGYGIIQLALGLLGLGVMFPTVKNGLWNLLRFHADSDSMAVLPLVPALLGAVCVVISPDVLAMDTVHLYVPCALLALFCNIIGRLLMVRRALRNVNVISARTKAVLSMFRRRKLRTAHTGVLHDIPIVTAVRKADGLCDILRYSYSTDMADGLCRTMTPICGIVTLLIAVGMTLIRMGTAVGMPWISFLCSMLALLQTASCCTASALVVNLPLERESRRAAVSNSAMLGYQSVDDFFDTNALLVEANDLFPKGSVQIEGMKVFSGAKVDDVLLDAASLVHHGDSMLQGAFAEMIPDVGTLLPVDEFVCEDGQGFCGWIANQRVLFGSREMMANHNIEGLPTKTREAELAEGNGDVLYLSVSGMLAALFSIRITADPHVKRQMQALRQERVALILRSVDCSVSLRRLSALFDFPESYLKIIPTSMHHLFQRETGGLGCVSASMTVGDSGFGAGALLLGARRVRRAAVIGVILLVVAGLLGLSLAMIHVVTGAYEKMTAYFFLIYHVILTAVTALAVRLR
ncbi:MAG: hypothetical protein ACLSFT_08485 [Ruminococcus callidus]